MKSANFRVFLEARKNPKQNQKYSNYQEMVAYWNRFHPEGSWREFHERGLSGDLYVNFSNVEKIGINPKPGYETTPLGFYAYPLSYAITTIENESKRYSNQPRTTFLPFAGDRSFLQLFRVDRSDVKSSTDDDLYITTKHEKLATDYLLQVQQKNLQKYIGDKEISDEQKAVLRKAMTEIVAKVAKQVDDLYTFSKRLVFKHVMPDKPSESKVAVWTKLMLNLGIKAVSDYGVELIHENEPYQIVVLDVSVIKDVSVVRSRQVATNSIDTSHWKFQDAVREYKETFVNSLKSGDLSSAAQAIKKLKAKMGVDATKRQTLGDGTTPVKGILGEPLVQQWYGRGLKEISPRDPQAIITYTENYLNVIGEDFLPSVFVEREVMRATSSYVGTPVAILLLLFYNDSPTKTKNILETLRKKVWTPTEKEYLYDLPETEPVRELFRKYGVPLQGD